MHSITWQKLLCYIGDKFYFNAYFFGLKIVVHREYNVTEISIESAYKTTLPISVVLTSVGDIVISILSLLSLVVTCC